MATSCSSSLRTVSIGILRVGAVGLVCRVHGGAAVLVATWNVNSLKQRMPRVMELLERHAPDVVCLQETKCGPEAFPHLELQAAGYSAVDHSGGRWAGVALLVRDGASVDELSSQLPGDPVPEEARWVEARIDGVRFASVYVVNGRSLDDPAFETKLRFLEAMRDRMVAMAEDGPAVVAGDFNIAPRDEDVWDIHRFGGSTHVSPHERARLQAMIAAGYEDAWDAAAERGEHAFTWWDYRAGAFHRNLGMRIDLALVTSDLARRAGWCGIDRDLRKGTKPSDHAPLLVRFRD